MFQRNEGTLDRVLRVLIGAVLLPVGLFILGGAGAGVVGVVVAAFGLWVLATGAAGVCPLYVPFKISTIRTNALGTPPFVPAR